VGGLLLVAGANHARILLQHGLFWDYGGLSWASAAYLSGLTILDPLTATLLFARPRIGIAATIVLIVTNVIHNIAVTAHYAPQCVPGPGGQPVPSQQIRLPAVCNCHCALRLAGLDGKGGESPA
jgi:hypothetical protein